MKRWIFGLIAIVAFTAASHGDQNEKPWLDLQNCSVCKCMGENMDMMQHVTWENHKISNGVLSASVIPDKYRDRMDQLHVKMKAVTDRLEKGEEMPLCGFCTTFEELRKAGAKTEEIKTDFGMIALTTSDDPEIVKRLHAHTDKTVAEFKKFLEGQQKPE